MIKRNYFIRAKIAHDNNTGLYSWWSGTMVVKSLLPWEGKDLFNAAYELAKGKIIEFEGEHIAKNKAQIISLNKI